MPSKPVTFKDNSSTSYDKRQAMYLSLGYKIESEDDGSQSKICVLTNGKSKVTLILTKEVK